MCKRPVDYSASGVRNCHEIPLRSGPLPRVIFVVEFKRLFRKKLYILYVAVVLFVMCEIYQWGMQAATNFSVSVCVYIKYVVTSACHTAFLCMTHQGLQEYYFKCPAWTVLEIVPLSSFWVIYLNWGPSDIV